MNGRNKDAYLIWGVVAGALVFGGAIAAYIALRDEPAMQVEQAQTADGPSAALERRTPASAARPAGSAAAEASAAGEAGGAARTGGAPASGATSAGAPLSQPEPSIPLPSLDESDVEVRSRLNELVGERPTTQFLLPERIVRNVVVTLDNLTHDKASIEQRPVKPTQGKFLIGGDENAPVLDPENYARYAPFIAAVERLDARRLVAMYRDMQPLFQQAYEELGHPNESFNERLLEIIEHLLETPDVQGTIRLVQPGLLYEYADEELQSLSVGKKLLIRLGPQHRAVVKEKLREIRAELV